MRKIFIKIIEFYQKDISPLKGRSCCIFYPTCSEYAKESYKIHGVIKGTVLTLYRILRCNPFNKNGGYDPVPEKLNFNIFRRKK